LGQGRYQKNFEAKLVGADKTKDLAVLDVWYLLATTLTVWFIYLHIYINFSVLVKYVVVCLGLLMYFLCISSRWTLQLSCCVLST
jgi:hypothetical protein